MVINAGDDVPNIEAHNQRGELIRVDISGPTVIFFYPEDGTPGCETEAQQFEREQETYGDAGVDVYGVSRDSVESHREFADELNLSFDILSDPDGTIAEKFEVPLNNGRAERTTFVVNNGKIHDVFINVNPDGHAREVLMGLLEDNIVTLSPP